MEKNKEIIFQDTVKTTNESRIQLIEGTIKVFEKNKLAVPIDQYELYLILDEAISNAMEHGNRWNIEKKVHLTVLRVSSNMAEVQVEDEGQGFDPGTLAEKSRPNTPLSPRGRGIIIIKKFCEVSWSNSGRKIHLFIKLKE